MFLKVWLSFIKPQNAQAKTFGFKIALGFRFAKRSGKSFFKYTSRLAFKVLLLNFDKYFPFFYEYKNKKTVQYCCL